MIIFSNPNNPNLVGRTHVWMKAFVSGSDIWWIYFVQKEQSGEKYYYIPDRTNMWEREMI